MAKFSKKEALKFGWETFKTHWKLLLGVLAVSFLVSVIPSLLASYISDDYWVATLVLGLVQMVLAWVVGVGAMRIYLRLVTNQETHLGDILVKDLKLVINFVLAGLLTSLIVAGGLLLFIIPGLIFTLRLFFTGYLVVDQNLGPVAAVKKSWAMTRGSAVNILFFNLLLGLISLVGLLTLGLGLLITAPVSAVATAYVYKKLEA